MKTGSSISSRAGRVVRFVAAAVILLAPALPAAAGVGQAKTLRPGLDGCNDEVVRGELGTRLDTYLTRAVPFGFSGSVFVRDADGVLLHKGYGEADRVRHRPIRIDTVFDMGSITKALTATGIALLESEGRLDFTDTLGTHFHDVPPDKRGITVEQLLTHTSGLIDLTEDNDYVILPRHRFLRDLFATRLISPPGEQWSYSNAGYSVLAALIENISGLRYEEYMRKRILDPAGMIDTGYMQTPSIAARAAHTYTPPVDYGSPVARLQATGGPHWVLLGNGGMLTTSVDLCRFDRAFVRGAVIARPMLATLTRGARSAPRRGVSRLCLDGRALP